MLLDVEGICKRYGARQAVLDLSFSVERGELLGLLGPNGAGKSSCMNMLAGCLAPDGGRIRIGGFDLAEGPAEAKRLIGYLPEQPPLYEDMRVGEYLDHVAAIKGLSREEGRAESLRVAPLTGLTGMERRLIRFLSKGYRQRLGVAQALLGNPPLLILDEPSSGLDPRQISEFRSLIARLGRDHAVILSTHILAEASTLCSRLLIMDRGRVVATGSPADLLPGAEAGGQGGARLAALEELFLRLTAGEDDRERVEAGA
jgi:ABC-2 type transport system ATP-binding protein